jgi:pimeloyl-ACP methyl ester carboxylesterase
VVIPEMPGYGFSGKPTTTGWGPERIARAWTVLMKRLGYTKFVAQGGDWGALLNLGQVEGIAIYSAELTAARGSLRATSLAFSSPGQP